MVRKAEGKDLYPVLDSAADVLRSKMDASEYKNYLLGMIFYKYLSDQLLNYVFEYSEDAEFEDYDQSSRIAFYRELYNNEELSEDLTEDLKETFKYSMDPDHTFDALLESVLGQSDEPFQLETFAQGLRNVEQSNERFEGLFADMDLNSRRLGSTRAKQSATIADVIRVLSQIDLGSHSGDVLGDGYEYLIRQFAMSSGKRAGEFYTPHEVSDLMSRITVAGNDNKKGLSVYDATCGSGSLLLNVKNYVKDPNLVRYFGQELNTTTYNLARMNMLLHDVSVDNYILRNADTLDEDWPTDEPTDFDAVLMNPPYSAQWSANPNMMDDSRFSGYGRLAPKGKADLAFLLHGYHHLNSDGTMAIVLPHGVLFRGGAEEDIRKKLLEEGAIDTIIGLPGGIFYNTPIPTTILILKKNRTTRDVLFIDASELYNKEKAQNVLGEDHVDEIINLYKDRQFVDKKAYLADFDEIKENDFNLNIPRYVDTFEEPKPIDLRDVITSIKDVDETIKEKETELLGFLNQMVGIDDETNQQLDAFRLGVNSDE